MPAAVNQRDAFRQLIQQLGGSVSILRPVRPPPRTEFTQRTRTLWHELVALQAWLGRVRPDYLDVRRHRATAFSDPQREEVDREATDRLRDAVVAIQELKRAVAATAETNDEAGHRYGVLLYLNDAVARLETQHKTMRDFRLRESISRKELSVFSSAKVALDELGYGDHASTSTSASSATPSANEDQYTPDELAQLQEENMFLHNEMNSLVSEVREVEKRVLEISRLETILEGHVTQQAHEIELLYEEAVSTTERVKQGNKALQTAKQTSSSFRRYILLFIILMSLALLFLDWYSTEYVVV